MNGEGKSIKIRVGSLVYAKQVSYFIREIKKIMPESRICLWNLASNVKKIFEEDLVYNRIEEERITY